MSHHTRTCLAVDTPPADALPAALIVVADDRPERDDARWLTTLLLVGAA